MDPTTPAAWAAKKTTKLITLPSGAVVRVKESTLHPLLLSNILPMQTIGKVASGEQPVNPGDAAEMVAGLKRVMGLVCQIVVEPTITMDAVAPEGMISIIDVPDADLSALIAYVLRTKEAEALTSFPDGAVSGPDRSPVPALPSATVNGAGPGG